MEVTKARFLFWCPAHRFPLDRVVDDSYLALDEAVRQIEGTVNWEFNLDGWTCPSAVEDGCADSWQVLMQPAVWAEKYFGSGFPQHLGVREEET